MPSGWKPSWKSRDGQTRGWQSKAYWGGAGRKRPTRPGPRERRALREEAEKEAEAEKEGGAARRGRSLGHESERAGAGGARAGRAAAAKS
eukprot:3540260-Alexandrium_andersonii.AAC.1